MLCVVQRRNENITHASASCDTPNRHTQGRVGKEKEERKEQEGRKRDRRGQGMTDGRPRHGAGGGAKHHLITAHRTTTGPIPQEEGRKKRKVGRQEGRTSGDRPSTARVGSDTTDHAQACHRRSNPDPGKPGPGPSPPPAREPQGR